jgi:hypothetical protein
MFPNEGPSGGVNVASNDRELELRVFPDKGDISYGASPPSKVYPFGWKTSSNPPSGA